MAGKRRPRFRRTRIPYQSTTRDLEIVRHIARHRFLTTQHILKLVKGGGQGIIRRLQTLYHSGVLDRPRAQLEYFHRGGSKPMVYGLGPQGARMLSERGEKSKIDWTAKNRLASKLFIEHTLKVANFMVAVEVACRESDNVRLVPAEEIAAQLGRRTRADLRWQVSLTHRGESFRLGIIPDGVFALEPKDQPSNRVYYFLEADRATMPVERRRLDQTSASRKFLAYHATWAQRVLRSEMDIRRFRVITMTTSLQRLENLMDSAGRLPSGHGLFLFCTEDELPNAQDLIHVEFRCVDGTAQPLTPAPIVHKSSGW